jgi:hypothetical protein
VLTINLNFTHALYILYLQASKAQVKGFMGRNTAGTTGKVSGENDHWSVGVARNASVFTRRLLVLFEQKLAGPCNKLQVFNRTPQTRPNKTNPTWTICSIQEDRRKVFKRVVTSDLIILFMCCRLYATKHLAVPSLIRLPLQPVLFLSSHFQLNYGKLVHRISMINAIYVL